MPSAPNCAANSSNEASTVRSPMRFTLRDDPRPGHDLPLQRKLGGGFHRRLRRSSGPDHHAAGEKARRNWLRQGIQDGFERGGFGHVAMALAVNEFGLDVQLS